MTSRKGYSKVAEGVYKKGEEIWIDVCKYNGGSFDNIVRLNIRPMPVNEAWQGRRFKSKKYTEYSKLVKLLLPKMIIPKPPLKVSYEFGFSNKASDLDNPVKAIQDIISQFYGFNDREIYELYVKKVIVSKGNEYLQFKIESL